jgi:glutathione S-transferase
MEMLELYQFEECEFSAQVRLKMSEWQIDYILRNVSRDKSKRPFLKKISGRSETPTLVDFPIRPSPLIAIVAISRLAIVLQHVMKSVPLKLL